MDHQVPVMLVGAAGSGKTVLVSEKLAALSENHVVAKIPFNFYTSSGKRFWIIFSRPDVRLSTLILPGNSHSTEFDMSIFNRVNFPS